MFVISEMRASSATAVPAAAIAMAIAARLTLTMRCVAALVSLSVGLVASAGVMPGATGTRVRCADESSTAVFGGVESLFDDMRTARRRDVIRSMQRGVQKRM